MSSIAVQGGATGTGTFTLLAPSTSTNRTLTLPDSAGTVATAESTLSQFNASGSAPVYACRAWVNFNGTGTVAIRASGNVTSITDNGVGLYTVNFTTAMPDANYAVQVVPDDAGSVNPVIGGGYLSSTRTTSAYQLQTVIRTSSASLLYDAPVVNVSVFR